LLIAIPVGLARARTQSRALLFCVVTAAAYLAPLFLSDASDHHEVSQYSMIGIHFMVLAAALALNTLTLSRAGTAMLAAAGIAVWAMTVAIAVATVFIGVGSSLAVSLPKGMMRHDTGIKAAGYFIRRHISPDVQILSLHESLNRYSAAYYLRGGNVDGLYVLNGNRDTVTRAKLFAEFAESVDLVVVSRDIVEVVEKSRRFEQALVIQCEGEPCVWIFSRPGIDVLRGVFEAADYNDDFDREYAPRSVPLLDRDETPLVFRSALRVDEFDAEAFGHDLPSPET
jgi:hypothetical protein